MDEAIVEHVRTSSLHPIYSKGLLRVAAAQLGEPESMESEKQWRLIDRRLQALRRAGKITYSRKVEKGDGQWQVVQPNDDCGGTQT